ncbi:MAG TPA: hypothetical protein VF175_17900 [Lacipirellula sp.]
MDRAHIEPIVAALDQTVPKEGARMFIRQYGGGPDECVVVANEAGYLRLGIELLKAALAPTGFHNRRDAVEIDVDYLLRDSEVQLDWLERREPDAEGRLDASSHGVGGVVGMLIGFGLLGVFLVGGATVCRWAYDYIVSL